MVVARHVSPLVWTAVTPSIYRFNYGESDDTITVQSYDAQ